MTTPSPRDPIEPNPFSSRCVRPGALPYLFTDGTTLASLIARLQANHGWGQIIGPHGTGKSTLLVGLLQELAAAGQQVHAVTLRDEERRLPREFSEALRRANSIVCNTGGQILVSIDGYEQLSWLRRTLLRRRCRARRWGLLVTAHSDAGLPPLWSTRVDVELAATLVDRLDHEDPPLATREQLSAALQSHAGNFREVLSDLYDEYERRRR